MSRPTKPLLTNALLEAAYENGLFPMAEGDFEGSPVYWYQPDPRAVITLDSLHIPKRLGRLIRSEPFDIKWNDDFRAVMTACGEDRSDTWINPEMIDAYTTWSEAGGAYCLSVFQEGIRVGGVYGVHVGGVFMAESMFSRVPNTSSVALIVLIAGLRRAGVELIDVQLKNAHSSKFGVIEIAHEDYMHELMRLKDREVVLKSDYFCFAEAVSFVQSFNQTS